MTYPNQQQYPPAPQAPYQPAQPQPGYPAQQQYPPAPQQPAYPQQQGYAQPGYPQQAPPQAPPPPLPHTTAADYLDQPAMGGLSLQFPAIGTSYTGIVARDLGDADFPVQTERDGVTPKRFRDGRPMVRMVVPLNVRPDQRHTDGRATLSVQGQMSEALKQAMSAAGAGHLNGIPENGAEITVTFVNQMVPKTQGFSGAKVYEVIYRRPAGAAPGAQGNGQAQEQPPWTPQQVTQTTVDPQAQYQYAQQGQPPYQQPYNAQQGMQRFAPEMQPPVPQQPPAPQMPAQPAGMAGPAQQVAAATQAAVQAGQQHQAPAPQAPPQGMHPYTAALMKQATGQQLSPEDQAALQQGPPQ